jgi:transcriptional regulator with XRE-family HTH domain
LSTSADLAREALGIRLRDIRRDSDLSGIELARANGWQSSKVSKIEHGKQTPSESDLRAWCRRCDSLNQLPDLIANVRAIETQFAEWRRILKTGTSRRQRASAAILDRTRYFRIYEPALIPGLLQTLDYATAVLSTVIDFRQIPDDASEGAQARINNQRVLTHGDRRFHILIGQQALLTSVGGLSVMKDQLHHLLTILKLPRVRLGIVPLVAPYRVPLHNAFWILDDGLVQFDTYTAELSLARPDEIATYGRAFERLAALAAYGPDAYDMVNQARDRLAG